MKQTFILILVSIIQISSFAQNEIQPDSSSTGIYQKEQERIKIQDSLRAEFYKKPATFILSLEKNREPINLSENYQFWIENNNKRHDLRYFSSNQFFVDSIADTISITLIYEEDTLKFTKIEYSWIKNGVYLHFGIIQNLEEVRKYYKMHKSDENFNEWRDLGQPYLRLLKSKKLKRNRRKVGEIIFVVVSPRTYGDGTGIEITSIKPKN